MVAITSHCQSTPVAAQKRAAWDNAAGSKQMLHPLHRPRPSCFHGRALPVHLPGHTNGWVAHPRPFQWKSSGSPKYFFSLELSAVRVAWDHQPDVACAQTFLERLDTILTGPSDCSQWVIKIWKSLSVNVVMSTPPSAKHWDSCSEISASETAHSESQIPQINFLI